MSMTLATLPESHSTPRGLPSGQPSIIRSLEDVYRMAEILFASRLIPESIRSVDQAVVIILKGRELGIPPMESFSSIAVIKGKPTTSPQCMLGLINRSGLLEDLTYDDDGENAVVTMKRKGRSAITKTFGMKDARLMGLDGLDQWRKQPKTMRQWRAFGANCRINFPDVIGGLYLHEEMGCRVDDEGELLGGEVIEAEVVEPRAAGTPRPENKGLSTKEHKQRVAEFLRWLEAQCAKINERWHQRMDLAVTRALENGMAVPAEVPDLINKFQAKNHLIKWARCERLIPDAVVPEGARVHEVEGHLAAVFFGPGGKDRIKEEMARYLAVGRGAIYREHPELAPDGYFEVEADVDADEAFQDRGDAYEEPDVEPEPSRDEAITTGHALFAWVKEQEQRHEVGLLKYLFGWAKVQGFPPRMVDWDLDQVGQAEAEAGRKLQSVISAGREPAEEALA